VRGKGGVGGMGERKDRGGGKGVDRRILVLLGGKNVKEEEGS